MKTSFLNIALLALSTTFFAACGGEPKQTTEQTGTNSEVAALYTCPMHPKVTSAEPGKCPECGMNLEKAKSQEHAAEDGHGHEDGHAH